MTKEEAVLEILGDIYSGNAAKITAIRKIMNSDRIGEIIDAWRERIRRKMNYKPSKKSLRNTQLL